MAEALRIRHPCGRVEVCINCLRDWNVSALAVVSESGYICPSCDAYIWSRAPGRRHENKSR